MSRQYYLSDSEDWFTEGPFASREDAIAEGREIYEIGFFTGVRKDVALPCVGYAGRVLDRMDEWLFDNVGEASEGAFDPSTEQLDDLDKELASVIQSWIERHGLHLGCFRIVEVQQHEQQDTNND